MRLRFISPIHSPPPHVCKCMKSFLVLIISFIWKEFQSGTSGFGGNGIFPALLLCYKKDLDDNEYKLTLGCIDSWASFHGLHFMVSLGNVSVRWAEKRAFQAPRQHFWSMQKRPNVHCGNIYHHLSISRTVSRVAACTHVCDAAHSDHVGEAVEDYVQSHRSQRQS